MSQRMPSCIGLTHGQIWKLFQESYGDQYREAELRAIHHKWIRAGADAGFRRNRVQGKDALPPR